jgi:hypothetical protein
MSQLIGNLEVHLRIVFVDILGTQFFQEMPSLVAGVFKFIRDIGNNQLFAHSVNIKVATVIGF